MLLILLGELFSVLPIRYVCNAVIYAFACLLFSDRSSKLQKDGLTTKSVLSLVDQNYISATFCNVHGLTLYCLLICVQFVVMKLW